MALDATPLHFLLEVDGSKCHLVDSGSEGGRRLTPHLYTFDEITRLSDTAVVDGLSHDGAELLQTIANWSRDYLTNPHPALGRSGDVCPWVQASIQTGRFYLSMIARP